jgi:DNA-binding NarL/FixJ family response regulator
MATVLLVGVDLFFRSKLDSLLAGHRILTKAGTDPPDLVICDLMRVEPETVAEAWPAVPLLGFTNHTDTPGLRRAHAAGFTQVIVKSALVERGARVVSELINGDVRTVPE